MVFFDKFLAIENFQKIIFRLKGLNQNSARFIIWVLTPRTTTKFQGSISKFVGEDRFLNSKNVHFYQIYIWNFGHLRNFWRCRRFWKYLAALIFVLQSIKNLKKGCGLPNLDKYLQYPQTMNDHVFWSKDSIFGKISNTFFSINR